MPVNVEIKARIESIKSIEQAVEALTDTPCQILDQEDVFFHSSTGRLKLRVCSQSDAELIFYQRDDTAEPKPSEYTIYKSSNPESLKEILAATAGIIGIVKKRRLLYIVGQTRVHLDTVEGLGSFMELEVVMQPGQKLEEGRQIAYNLMESLNVRQDCLIKQAYIDLLCASRLATD